MLPHHSFGSYPSVVAGEARRVHAPYKNLLFKNIPDSFLDDERLDAHTTKTFEEGAALQ
jgi:hypothetical protein